MTVGFIGSGMIGGTVARLSVAAGHHVVLSNSRGPETLAELAAELGPLATPAARAGIASALLNASREMAGLLGITVIGAVLRTRQSAALRAGAGGVHAFLDGYHAGLLVTIALLAAGVVISYLTLRPRPAAPGASATE